MTSSLKIYRSVLLQWVELLEALYIRMFFYIYLFAKPLCSFVVSKNVLCRYLVSIFTYLHMIYLNMKLFVLYCFYNAIYIICCVCRIQPHRLIVATQICSTRNSFFNQPFFFIYFFSSNLLPLICFKPLLNFHPTCK